MAKGDENDFYARLRALLPQSWFSDDASVLKGLLSAGAKSLSWCHALYIYARQQTRISTSTDGWLDLTAYDFFGRALQRPRDMSDDSFRRQMKINLFRERGTRQSLITILEELTASKPFIFEPSRPQDTGAYGGPIIGYGEAGGYGSLRLPYQAFVVVRRPRGEGIPWVAGYQTPVAGYGKPSRGEYVSRDIVVGSVTDNQIYAAISAVKIEGTIVWVRIC